MCVCACVCVHAWCVRTAGQKKDKHSPKHQIFLFTSLWLIISLVVVGQLYLLCTLLKGHQLQNVVMA